MLLGGDSSLTNIVGEAPDKGQSDILTECATYVSVPSLMASVAISIPSAAANECGDGHLWQVSSSDQPIPPATLLRLYTKLVPGLSVSDWMEQNQIHLLGLE